MTDPQPIYFNTQNVVAPNIDTYYNRVIKVIDANRSTFNVGSSNISQSIDNNDLDNLFVNNQITGTTPQESRCSAFFRMMGLPVINGDGSDCYSPGFNPLINGDDDEISRRLQIANSCLDQFKGILDDREFYSTNIIKYFQAQDANSSALAISSIFPRSFGDQFQAGLSPTDIDNQAFTVPDRENVIFNFQDELNEDVELRLNSSTHILKPFIVDPRVDLTVNPAVNRICAPFLPDKSKTQISQNNYLKRPYIERVIRVRFDPQSILPSNNTNNQAYVNSIIEFAKSNSDITDNNIINALGNTLQSLHQSELVNISKLLNVIEALIAELVEATIEISKIRTIINWKPIPNVSGPEFGSTLNPVDMNDVNNNLKLETQIVQLQINKILNTTDFNIGLDQPDTGNFVFSDVDDIVFDSTKHNTDFYDKQLTQLNRRRNEYGNRANALLRNIEIITGEFSGLGLLDILAVQIALWAISPEAILGLIDTQAFLRMQDINALQTGVAPASPLEALTEFEKQISIVYATMEYFVNAIVSSDKKTQQN